ncbi:unnamed protein product, partial [Discosporangium mesarthrocarpum]
ATRVGSRAAGAAQGGFISGEQVVPVAPVVPVPALGSSDNTSTATRATSTVSTTTSNASATGATTGATCNRRSSPTLVDVPVTRPSSDTESDVEVGVVDVGGDSRAAGSAPGQKEPPPGKAPSARVVHVGRIGT